MQIVYNLIDILFTGTLLFFVLGVSKEVNSLKARITELESDKQKEKDNQ